MTHSRHTRDRRRRGPSRPDDLGPLYRRALEPLRRPALLSVALVLLAACCPKIYPTETRDSVRVEVHERLVHDTAFFAVPEVVERVVVQDTASTLENAWARSTARVSADGLHHTLETIPHVVRVPYEVTVRDTVTVEKHAETVVQEVNRLTSWQAFWLRLGQICASLLAVALLGVVVALLIRRYL